MSEFTKGPILIDERDGQFLLTADRSASDVEAIGVVYKRADAELFAAAPDLLTALEKALEILRHNPEAGQPPRYRNMQASAIIAAAIAKATAV